jgi:glycosyltransferase involved in cell wall biosynthesis
MPRISIVMPSYESAPYLRQAVISILQQTEHDIELIIVQEMGARDGTEALLNEIDDARVRVVRNDIPLGLARSLNRGFALASSEYVARMDADDVSIPERLEKQASYLDIHPSVGVVGSAVRHIDEKGQEIGAREYHTSPALVLWNMHFDCAMCHPSTMFRRSVFEEAGGYSAAAKDWEDYELWTRIMRRHSLSNLPDILLDYRIHSGAVSVQKREEQRQHIVECGQRAMEVTMARPVDVDFVRSLIRPYTIVGRREAIGAAWLLDYLYRSYRMWYHERNREDMVAVKNDVSERMSHILARSVKAAPMAVPMILWQASRGGPGVSARIGPATVRRGIERLNGTAAAKMGRRPGAVTPSTQ